MSDLFATLAAQSRQRSQDRLAQLTRPRLAPTTTPVARDTTTPEQVTPAASGRPARFGSVPADHLCYEDAVIAASKPGREGLIAYLALYRGARP